MNMYNKSRCSYARRLTMLVSERTSGDRKELRRRISSEKNAKQRDRLRAVALALEVQEAPRIARMLGRSRRFVQEWAYAYRDGGLEAVKATPQSGHRAHVDAVGEQGSGDLHQPAGLGLGADDGVLRALAVGYGVAVRPDRIAEDPALLRDRLEFADGVDGQYAHSVRMVHPHGALRRADRHRAGPFGAAAGPLVSPAAAGHGARCPVLGLDRHARLGA